MKRIILLLFCCGILAANTYEQIDDIIETAILNHIFPGATVAVGTADSILYHKAYGTFTYDAGSTPVDTLSMFDLASCTKVFATSMCMMKCIDSGLVSPEDYVKDWVPEFNNNGKGVIKVKHLLMHNSGLPAYTTAESTRSATLNKIYNIGMTQSLGTYTYSCLNFIMTMRVVEEATDTMMWEFYKKIYTDPMGMTRTMFCPPDSLHAECLPTTTSLQGSVHDPLAAGLYGYSGNAGLFSTTGELVKFCQLMLNHGSYDGREYVDSTTVVPFTTLQSANGSRAYGWGINGSSAGSLMSDLNYGHTGYTGTSAFIDPTRKLFVILLTNRVYPDDATSVTSTRQAVADAAVRAFDELPAQPRIHSIYHMTSGDFMVNWDYEGDLDSIYVLEKFDGESSGYNLFKLPADSSTIKLLAIDCYCQRSITLIPVYNGTIGDSSDTYFVKESPLGKYALIVDGYDRISNDYGWSLNHHPIAGLYANALPENWGYTTCDNQAIIDGDINLSNYDIVIWFCGDESTSDETFNSTEQAKVKTFLEHGGKLFVSGSEIGWDLSYKGTSSDRSFYENYLKTEFLGDDANDLTVFGRANTRFDGLSFNYGGSTALYREDYPDYVKGTGGSKAVLYYTDTKRAGTAYVGTFGTSQDSGKVVYLGFPFETIEGANKRIDLMGRIVEFFENATEVSVDDFNGQIPATFELKPAYPNPFNPVTTLEFTLPYSDDLRLSVYDLAGKCVDLLINKKYDPGTYSYKWNASNLPSGVYVCKLSFGVMSKVQKLVLLK